MTADRRPIRWTASLAVAVAAVALAGSAAPARPPAAPSPSPKPTPAAAPSAGAPAPRVLPPLLNSVDDEEEPSDFDEDPQSLLSQPDDASFVQPALGPKAARLDQVPAATANEVASDRSLPAGLPLWRSARLEKGAYVAKTADGRAVRLSIDPVLQAQMHRLFSTYKPESGALVALDPRTGRILAIEEHGEAGDLAGLATRPLYPAASVFKIVTGAALLEHGVQPSAETCYHGGVRNIVAKILEDKPRLDRRCLSLSLALAKSANVVFAKMALKHLDGAALRSEADRLLFNRTLIEDPGVEQSIAQIPDERVAFAKSAAGFGNVKLSPLHAATIAATVADGGTLRRPSLIDSIDGVPVTPEEGRRVMAPETASALREMMKLTVTEGTASRSFRERRGPVLGDIEVAGKTGSLSNHERPFKDYSWFVGFAPADNPRIAVAVVVVNGLKWKIHAPFVAREALRSYLLGGPLGIPPVARARAHHHRRHRVRRG